MELSEDELDNVAGGVGEFVLSGGQNLGLFTGASFQQKNLTVAQQTIAGPGGAGTTTLVNAQEIISNSGQILTVGN
ncbi:CTB family bacteriocin [Tolypothrix sp. PCC 7601]|uniref:CTB family bacteriocin n=1 Tax=Tolypothrix sp. PCC 7601 TaxID=1188 RepID=UPI001F243DFA|nr:CTB family bacteriocin [Tolypothrix sp. PCC 7601]